MKLLSLITIHEVYFDTGISTRVGVSTPLKHFEKVCLGGHAAGLTACESQHSWKGHVSIANVSGFYGGLIDA